MYAAGKKALKVYAEEHKDEEDNKIIQLIDGINAKKEEFKENHPKIGKFIEKANEILKKPETQWFINGVAVGYTVGKMGQGLKNLYDKNRTTPITDDKITGEIQGPQPQELPQITPSKPTIGDTVDVRGIKGYINSLGEGKTSIIKELAGNAEIIGEKNGYYLLNGSDGDLLGWFKISDIEEKAKIIKDVAETVSKSTR